MKKIILNVLAITGIIFGMQACKTYFFRSNYQDTNSLIHETKNIQTKPFLKAHIKNGEVCILRDSWKVDTSMHILSGIGTKYDFNRKLIFTGSINIPLDSVAIFETNVKIKDPEASRIAALSIMAGLDAVVGIICLTNPKACFGSCTTFYLNETDNFHYADAEGFSNAIAPAMEYDDIDALNQINVTNNVFSIIMKNEALETHCVNNVSLLAYPLAKGERVFQSPSNEFYLCQNNYLLTQAKANEGDISSLLRLQDRKERFSLADEKNLSSKEEIYLTFEQVNDPKDLGLILNFRQTMMTTYLFYSAMGYMGNQVSDIFSKLETDAHIRNTFDATTKELGNLEIYVWNEKKNAWEFQNHFYETGPIAINKQVIPIQNSHNTAEVRVKIILNKGLWRLDYASLTNIKRRVDPLAVSPSSIFNKGRLDSIALQQINSPKAHLLSMPGSEYKFQFTLPNTHTNYELFLCSKGYYLEWMRANWIKDKDLLKLKQMVDFPRRYLREEAKRYKQYETNIEQEFWNSKLDTKTFSYYEK